MFFTKRFRQNKWSLNHPFCFKIIEVWTNVAGDCQCFIHINYKVINQRIVECLITIVELKEMVRLQHNFPKR